MKKIVFSLLLTLLMIFPIGVFASGGISISPSSLSMEVGQTKTFTITATNTIGDVTISSSNSGVASVSNGFWETGPVTDNQVASGTITVTGVSEGTATITLSIDAATFDSEDLSGDRTISVTVTKHQESNPVPTTPVVKPDTNNNSNNTNTNNSNDTNTETKKEEKKSSNSKLKKISVENYELKKVNDNKYTLTVDNKITMITIKAEAEDSKAKLTGIGLHELKVGENDIEVVVTAEDNSTNRIRVVVTREEEEEVVVKPVEKTTEEDDTDSNENSINIIAIIMIALNVILAIAVIVLYGKNKKLKESIKKIG